MESTPIRRAGLLACLALLAPLASAQKPAGLKTSSTNPAQSFTVPGTSGSFLTGTDTCTTPTPVAGQQTVPFDVTTATTGTQGQTEVNCYYFGTSAIDNDVWWCWTPSISGTGRVSACGLAATDTKIAAYPGCGCPTAGSSLACEDDSCGLVSAVDFTVVASTTYTVQLGTYPGATPGAGSVSFGVLVLPPNDGCASPDVLPGVGTYAFDLQAATTGTQGQNELNCYAFGTSAIDADVWYAFDAACTGTATVRTCTTSTVDTKIAVYGGAGCPVDGTSLACNDDACGLQSSVSWPVTIGSTYTIQLGTFPGTASNNNPGMFTLSLTNCSSAYPAACFGTSGCPCANNGASGAGCESSLGVGAILAGSGVASLSNDTLVLTATQTTNQPGIFFQGNASLNPPPVFGDGFRCCGQNVVRCGTYLPSGNTTNTDTGNQIGGNAPPISDIGANSSLVPGDTRCYQWWYRDPPGPCGAGFNLSNSISATWLP